MQLTTRKRGPVAAGLSILSASLLAAGPAHAQDQSDNVPGQMDDVSPEAGSVVLDGSVLFYQEQGSRVRAIEPAFNGDIYLHDGSVVSLGVTFDTLTGATPNGAMPLSIAQTFNSIVKVPTTTQVTTTSASGGGTVTSIPGTIYAHAAYSTAANKLPLAAFHDQREAFNVGYSWLWDPDTRIQLGGAFSIEHDYTSITEKLGVSHDFNQKNTTVSLNANFEEDTSRPYNGTPAAFEDLSTQITGGNDHKTVIGVVAGLTQTLTRFWLAQLNYSFSTDNGYQADPYRVLSVLDASGTPTAYLYESRPRTRVRHSVYWGNKIAIGPTVADVSLRYYHDSWGINSLTTEISDQIPVFRYNYVQPRFRYYHQTAANFFRDYLDSGAALPTYASSDSRLGRFSAVSFGGRIGMRFIEDSDLYIDVERYHQYGPAFLAGAPANLAGQNVFSGVTSFSVMTGFKIKL